MLSDLNIKAGYNTDEHNIAESFYNPCLAEAVRYDRVAGYFSSHSLKFLTKGIESLILKNGKYRLIISKEISHDDYIAIKDGYVIRQKLKDSVKGTLDFIQFDSLTDQQRLANLAYLIGIGLIDIKIGFVHSGLFHAKFGLIADEENNIVYFSGSANETANAMHKNFENIDIKKSWLHASEAEYIENRQNYFNSLWNGSNQSEMLYIAEVNEMLKYHFSKYDRGGLVMDELYFQPNSLVLVYMNGRLKIINNLGEEIENSRYFLRLYRKFHLDQKSLEFKDVLNYKQFEEIISLLEKHHTRTSQMVVITKSVYEYIDLSRFEIDEIAKRGLLIKNQDESFVNFVNQFNLIVDREFADGFSLRGVQKWVSYYMSRMRRVANFSVPGSGKTAMVYGVFAYLSSPEIGEVDQIIMIGPKNSFLSWKDEFQKFFQGKRRLEVLDIHSSDFNEVQFVRSPHSYNLILINYESLKRYAKYLERIISNRTIIVFDEVHKIKKIGSERGEIAIKLASLAKYRFVLTGTPIPNSYLDIWNFLHILYKDEYMDYFGLNKAELSSVDIITQEKVNAKLTPFFWRVTKDNLGVPPPNKDQINRYFASDDEQDVLDLLWKKYRHSPLKLYIRLIQFSSNPELLTRSIEKSMFYDPFGGHDNENQDENLLFEYDDAMFDNIIDTYSKDELALLKKISSTRKFEAAIHKIDELVNNGKSVIVWCIFVDTISKVVKYCNDLGHRVQYIAGSVSSAERELIIKQFQDGLLDVLVTNPHTLAESVSLHKECHDAIYLEYSFNLTHMLQSRDRIHRFGLKANEITSYYYFMMEGQEGKRSTIDQKIYNRLKEKEQTMMNAIEGDLLIPDYTENEKDAILNLMLEEMNRNINQI